MTLLGPPPTNLLLDLIGNGPMFMPHPFTGNVWRHMTTLMEHGLVEHRPDGSYAAAVRAVWPDMGGDAA